MSDTARLAEMIAQTETELILARADLSSALNGSGDIDEARRAEADCTRRLRGLRITESTGLRVYWSGSLEQFVTIPE